jgi:CyaY protein
MDESRYQHLASDALGKVESMFEDVDAEDVDVERSGDVITLTFRDRRKCVVNTQRPTRQIWLAANARAWHFGYDEKSSRWLDDKDPSVELLSRIAGIVKELAGIELNFGR